METQTTVFAQATKLYQVALATAESLLRAAGSAGVPSREVFTLCQQECKQKVPSLDYDEGNFRTTVQDLFLKYLLAFQVRGGSMYIFPTAR